MTHWFIIICTTIYGRRARQRIVRRWVHSTSYYKFTLSGTVSSSFEQNSRSQRQNVTQAQADLESTNRRTHSSRAPEGFFQVVGGRAPALTGAGLPRLPSLSRRAAAAPDFNTTADRGRLGQLD